MNKFLLFLSPRLVFYINMNLMKHNAISHWRKTFPWPILPQSCLSHMDFYFVLSHICKSTHCEIRINFEISNFRANLVIDGRVSLWNRICRFVLRPWILLAEDQYTSQSSQSIAPEVSPLNAYYKELHLIECFWSLVLSNTVPECLVLYKRADSISIKTCYHATIQRLETAKLSIWMS